MKQKFLSSLLVLVVGGLSAAWGQDALWLNQNDWFNGPQIDALRVENAAGARFVYEGALSGLFTTSSTLTYSNRGYMFFHPGVDFQTFPASSGSVKMAANFYSLGGSGTNGTIEVGNTNFFFYAPYAGTFQIISNLLGNNKCLISASNIVIANNGTIRMNGSSLIALKGKTIDLDRGALTMATSTDSPQFFHAGWLDGNWGFIGLTNFFNRSGNDFLSTAEGWSTPVYSLVNRSEQPINPGRMRLKDPITYIKVHTNIPFWPNHTFTQVVILSNTNADFPCTVFGSLTNLSVQWSAVTTNWPAGTPYTNYLYLDDYVDAVFPFFTSTDPRPHGLINPASPSPKITYKPANFEFFFGIPYSNSLAAVVPPSFVSTNDLGFRYDVFNLFRWGAYQAIFGAASQLPTDVTGGNVTNLLGRIEVTADAQLNLNKARISALNYLLVRATNHFVTSSGATIASPNMDVYLRSTNGSLSISNLAAPYLNHIEGTCDLYSARWSEDFFAWTNHYQVLFVNSALSPITKVRIQSLALTVTNSAEALPQNLYIADNLNVTSNLTLAARSLTITTNPGNFFNPVGQLNLGSPFVQWVSATPGLRNLTNWGLMTANNSVYFGGSRNGSPVPPGLIDLPYEAFVNHGRITNIGSFVWSSNFLNSGAIQAVNGFSLQAAANALLTNGVIRTLAGDLSLSSTRLVVSNHALLAGNALSFDVAGYLDDGSLAMRSADLVTNKNFWSSGYGMNLLRFPTNGASLLATTLTNYGPEFQIIDNQWAAPDLGCLPQAFSNNAAVGHLILDGAKDCLFHFGGPGPANNALYVDCLELRNYVATNIDADGNFASIECAPNFKIYFAQALINGQSIAERLPLVNNGAFSWVSNYNSGFFSSTNMVYITDNSTNRLNTALVTSCSLDSDNDGQVNCVDPTPVLTFSPSGLGLAVGFSPLPVAAAQVSWNAFPASSNYLYSSTSARSNSWSLVTNFFLPGSFSAPRVTVLDPIQGSSPRFYRVKAQRP